jgi:hypothetical protein
MVLFAAEGFEPYSFKLLQNQQGSEPCFCKDQKNKHLLSTLYLPDKISTLHKIQVINLHNNILHFLFLNLDLLNHRGR